VQYRFRAVVCINLARASGRQARTNMESSVENKTSINKSIAFIGQIIGEISVLACICHAIFEIIKGNKKTVNIALEMGAISIFSNYLASGIVTLIFSIVLGIWLVFGIRKKYGTVIIFFFAAILLISGGGFAPIFGIVLSLFVSLLATIKTDRTIGKVNTIIGRFWKILFGIGIGLLAIGIVYWVIIIPPGNVHLVNIKNYINWILLLLGTLFLIFSIYASLMFDLANEKKD